MAMAGAVMSVVGGVVQGIGAQQAAEAQADAAEAQAQQAEAVAESHDYNAMVAQRNIGVLQQQTAAAVQDQAAEYAQFNSKVRGIFASNGIQMTGSALDVTMADTKEEKLGLLRISYKGRLAVIEQMDAKWLEEQSARQQRIGAQAYMDQAGSYRQAGQISMISGILGGISSGISSMSRMA